MSVQIPNEIGQFRETVAAWARNRELYPGWLIAPRETREVVWGYTSGWLKTVLDRLKEVEYEEQLEWCFELNWRLEVALVPLLPPLSDRIWELILAADPFAYVTSPPQWFGTLGPCRIQVSREGTGAVALSCLRNAAVLSRSGTTRGFRGFRKPAGTVGAMLAGLHLPPCLRAMPLGARASRSCLRRDAR